ncbi:MAG TPA: outer membrane protein [Pseudolabrys sp.]|nr:outer membrane protein [Pseudolabrys sp.]
MKKTRLAASLAAMWIGAGVAGAADLPRGPQPYYGAPMSTTYNWTGFYAGVNVGYEWGRVTNTPGSPSGPAGGGQFGYNWQSGQFVFGGETDLQITGADDTFAPYKFSNPWFGTLRGRAGVAFNNVLLYATLGLAYGDLKGQFAGLDETKTEIGWAGGLGAEYGFAQNWSAKVEYLYADLGSRTFSITGTDNGLHANLLRIGINYHF